MHAWTKVDGSMHVHKKKVDKTKKKEKKDRCMSMNKTSRTKYHKNGTLIEDYNVSRRLKVRASHIPVAVYQWPTMQKNVQSYV